MCPLGHSLPTSELARENVERRFRKMKVPVWCLRRLHRPLPWVNVRERPAPSDEISHHISGVVLAAAPLLSLFAFTEFVTVVLFVTTVTFHACQSCCLGGRAAWRYNC